MKTKFIIAGLNAGRDRRGWVLQGLLAWQILRLVPGEAASADPAQSVPAHDAQPIAWNDLGAKATAQYSGDGLAVSPTAKGAKLRCVFQKLEGEVTAKGLSLSSTAPGSNAYRAVQR